MGKRDAFQLELLEQRILLSAGTAVDGVAPSPNEAFESALTSYQFDANHLTGSVSDTATTANGLARTETPHNQERRPRRTDGCGERRTVAETVGREGRREELGNLVVSRRGASRRWAHA